MTTPRDFNTLGVLGTLLIAASVVVLLAPLALPAAGAQVELRTFVLQLLGTVSLLSRALWALVSASEQTARAPAAARKTSSGNTARTAVHQPTGVAGAAA
ncbi:MAG: hypothetical protein AB7N69_01015 [Immundisolibacter sp.]|uniref:hypothetical protein n=1 Tax=Immundisolibacter sp. TaxID=1934948 RepID=UPI003D108873